MVTKVKELDNTREGDRNGCPICSPSKKRIREDQVWSFVHANPGVDPWRSK